MMSSPDGNGYGIVTSFGRLFSYGDFPSDGDVSNLTLSAPIVAAVARPTGGGYWFGATDGGVFAFGGAPFLGAPWAGLHSTCHIVGMTGDGHRTGLLARRRRRWHLRLRRCRLLRLHGRQTAQRAGGGHAATPSGLGYWLVAADGGIFAFGDAPFYGSMGGQPPTAMVAMAATAEAGGYWLAGGRRRHLRLR